MTNSTQDVPAKLVAIRPIGGLASRLKCIASFAVLAQHWQCPYYVYWSNSPSFEDVSWETLFEQELPFTVEWIDEAKWTSIRTTKDTIKLESFIPYLSENYRQPFTDIKPLFQTRRPQKITAECNRELSTVYSSQLSYIIRGFHASMKQYWGSFNPAQGIREIIGTQIRQWNLAGATDVLGIHVRRNDALQSRLSARYSSPSDEQILKWIKEQVARNSDSNPSAEDNKDTRPHFHVFVATDDPHVAETIYTHFGEDPCVHMYPWKRYVQKHGESIHGQTKAVVDLYTLRFCNRIVGCDFSVFTKMAKDTASFERTSVDTFIGDLGDSAHGLSPQEWDTEPEPRHLIEERERKKQEKQVLVRKMATEIVNDLVDTVVNRLQPPKPVTPVPSINPTVITPLFQRGDHVALIGDAHPEWRGRRGICIDYDEQNRMKVVVDADSGILLDVPDNELIAVAKSKPVGSVTS